MSDSVKKYFEMLEDGEIQETKPTRTVREITEEEKQQLSDIFRKYYQMTQSSFTNLKEKLKGCLVIVFAL